MTLRFQPIATIGMTAIERAECQNLRYTIWRQDRVTFNFLRTYGLSVSATDNKYLVPNVWKNVARDGEALATEVVWLGSYEKCIEMAELVAAQRALNDEQNHVSNVITALHNNLEDE